MEDCIFPKQLKESEVIPVYKKLDPLMKENYRPVSLLPHVSKVFERILYKQIDEYMENKFSNLITGFRKSHGTQHALVIMLEKWKEIIDKGEYISVVYMDLSKAFDTINHDLLLAKLKAYGFSKTALNLMCSYLKRRKQKVLINNKTSLSKEIIAGVPQGSIDGPLLFNIFINDLFLFLYFATLSNYADDNNLFTSGCNKDEANEKLLADFRTVMNWFYENFMILNTGKCHYMCIGKDTNEKDVFKLNESQIMKNSEEVDILGIKVDRKLTFHQHIKEICKKAGQKLSALLRMSPYIDKDKRKIIYNSIIKSQFNYCPLVWMFCLRKSNNLMNKIQERALRITHNDFESDFEELLLKNNEITIHHRNLQVLMTEIYKIVNNFAPPIMKSLFESRENNHNLRNFQDITTSRRRTVRYGLETVSYRAPFIWSKLPPEFKEINSVKEFKSKIKSWKAEICPCNLCKKYQPNLGYL